MQSSYYFTRTLNMSFDDALESIAEALRQEGFGILTEIDVKETLKKKLDVDFRNYRILGACNPPFAYKALKVENKIGVMLPCNVVVQEVAPDKIEISAIDPGASMQVVNNPHLFEIAAQIREKLLLVVQQI